MIEYGYINDGGYLVSKFIEEHIEKYRDTDDEIKSRTITIEEQAAKLSAKGWKPVDPVNSELLECPDGYVVRIIPYDAGEKISYRYETVFDTQKVRRDIQVLKDRLAGEDYKVIKCYEANLLGLPLPYDVQQIHGERQAYRDKINELEASLPD